MQSSTLEFATRPVRAAAPKRWVPARWVRQWLRLKLIVGGVVVLALLAVGVFGPLAAPYDPNVQDLTSSLVAPQWMTGSHVLGTDSLGRDILSRLMHGARVSLIIAFAVVVISGVVGVVLGATSGYYGGRVDFLIQKLVEVVWAFPALLLAIAIMTFLGQGLINLLLALVAQRWIGYCRVVRSETLSLRQRDFVTAARVIGARDGRIIGRHVLPNVLPTSLVIATFTMASAIISESSLSFLGLGVPPDTPTWGTMLADSRNYLSTAPWPAIFPGLAIFVVVLGINLLGDGLRDVLDPHMQKTASSL